jgi:hydrogenase maturation protease
MGIPGVMVIEQPGEGTALMEAIRCADNVYLVDAVSSGARAGTVHRIDFDRESLPKSFQLFSTHAFGVAQAVKLARTMNMLPAKFILFGIEGKNFEPGKNLSSEISSAIQKVISLLTDEILSTASGNLKVIV